MRKILIILALFGLLIFNFSTIKEPLTRGLEVLNPTAPLLFLPYEQKLRFKTWPLVVDYYDFIKANTPDNARILIPPLGHPWPMTGNAFYLRYFVYPRLLYTGEEKTPGINLKEKNIQFILLVWGESWVREKDYTHGFPKFKVPAKRIIYKTDLTHVGNLEKMEVRKDFDPQDPENFGKWGLIEVDQERL